MTTVQEELEKQRLLKAFEISCELYTLLVQRACYDALPWYKKLWWQLTRPR